MAREIVVGTSMMHRMSAHQPQANSGSDAGPETPVSPYQSAASVDPELLSQLEGMAFILRPFYPNYDNR